MTPQELIKVIEELVEEYDEAHITAQQAAEAYQDDKADRDACYDRHLEAVTDELDPETKKPRFSNPAKREAEVLRRIDAERPGLLTSLGDHELEKQQATKTLERIEKRLNTYRDLLNWHAAEAERAAARDELEAARLRASIAATPAAAPRRPVPRAVTIDDGSSLPF